jgi:hypothetical protein
MRKYLPALALLLLLPIVQASVSVSPSSLNFSLNIGENASQTLTLIVDNASYSDVQVFVVGNSPTSDEVLRACVTVYPSYIVKIENENRQFTVRVSASGVNPGTYTGIIRFTQIGYSVPITVFVAGVYTGYLEADKGSIKATLPSGKSIKKAVIFYNKTGQALRNFTAEMEDTQVYDDIDWIQVEYEAPQFVQPDGYVTVSLTIDTTNVPTGRYQRRLQAWAWSENRKYSTEVMLDITVYGGKAEAENISSLNVSVPQDVTLNSQTTIRVTSAGGNPVAGADVLLDGNKVGTTDTNGLFSLTISTKGTHTITVKYKDKQESKTVTAFSYAPLQINAPTRVSDEISGTVTNNGVPVAGVRVMLGSVSAVTDSGGNFRLSLSNLEDGIYTLTANKRDEQEYVIYSGNLSVEVRRLHIPYTWVVSVIATVGIILVAWKGGLFEKLKGEGKVEKV